MVWVCRFVTQLGWLRFNTTLWRVHSAILPSSGAWLSQHRMTYAKSIASAGRDRRRGNGRALRRSGATVVTGFAPHVDFREIYIQYLAARFMTSRSL
jgi:hypothetical protein